MKKNLYRLVMFFVMIFVMLSKPFNSNAATMEQEPNNNTQTAQPVSLGVEYEGAVVDSEVDDEDYFKISVKEGQFYQIDVYDIKDIGDYEWNTMIVHLCKETDTDSGYTITGGFDYSNSRKLFRAAYTGNYYLKFYNTNNTKYKFKVNNYNPKGKKVKDSDSNTYKITGNYTLEFSKIASMKTKSFYISDDEYFKEIGGIEVLDYYDTTFTITAIGNNAFKGSGIKSISIPENVKKIGKGAFQNCKKLGTERYFMGVVIYGKNVTIESNAFSGCKNLGSIRIIKGASIKSVKKNAFKGTKNKIRLEVPNIKKYKKIFKNAGLRNPEFSKSYL